MIARKNISKGFTLIELLVVISIIALLVSILMPALNKAKEQATSVVCLANIRSLSQAYYMYAMDNDGTIVGGYVQKYDRITWGNYLDNQWVFSPRKNDNNLYDHIGLADGSSGAVVPTQDDRLTGIKAGKLWKYIKNTDVYHCPGDKRYIKPTSTEIIGSQENYMIYRSYSIPDCLYGSKSNLPYDYLQNPVTKITRIRIPSEKYCFVEANFPGYEAMPYNHGGFSFMPWKDVPSVMTTWWDPPAPFHNKSGVFGFLDGHSEKHKWEDKSTIEHTTSGLGSGSVAYDPDGDGLNKDVDWMTQGWPEDRNNKYRYVYN